MMKSAEDRPRGDVRTVETGASLANDRCVRTRCEDMTQVGLAKDHGVIQAFSTDGSNQPLRIPVLPG
jgi:hypothetical protein